MSTLDLTPEEYKHLESLRQRLATLESNLRSLRSDVLRSPSSLPSPSSLHASARIAKQNLSSLETHLSAHQDLLSRLAIHPSTNFPGRTQEAVAQILLRKKLEPEAEDWVEVCREAALGAGLVESSVGTWGGTKKREEREEEESEDEEEDGYRPEDDDEEEGRNPLNDLWGDVREVMKRRIKEFVEEESQDVYTREERERGVENVRTGLRRDLEEDEEEESEESEDEEEEEEEDGDEDVVMLGPGGGPVGGGPAKVVSRGTKVAGRPEVVLWFGVRGDLDLPRHIGVDATRRAVGGGARRGGLGR